MFVVTIASGYDKVNLTCKNELGMMELVSTIIAHSDDYTKVTIQRKDEEKENPD